MFENLSVNSALLQNLRGQGTLTEQNISEAIREIRLALRESDVNLTVVDAVIDHIRTRALGTQVTTALSPSEQIVKIVHDELINVLGKDTARFQKSSQPPSVILMAGLQGSGKTTTSGKLAQWLKKAGHRPMLVSVDVYRPAAREQLAIVARSTSSQIYEGKITEATPGTDAVLRLAKEAKREAANFGCDILIVDTAGRNQIDALSWTRWPRSKTPQPLRDPLRRRRHDRPGRRQLRQGLQRPPHHHRAILTKMDGDALGSLSIRHVTGAPIKFLGTGEKPDAFEPSTPTASSPASWATATSPPSSSAPKNASTAAKPSSSPRRPSPAMASPSTTSATSSVRSRRWAA